MSVFSSCGNGNHDEHAEHTNKEQELYTCSMHPEIVRSAPGNCPVCGMKLVKKEAGNKAIRDVGLETLLKPANEFVVSTVPVTAMDQREEDIELNVVGIVAHDTRQAGTIASRVNGRIEKLYIRYKYQPVKKGQKIMDIYSPELLTAQQNLIFLLHNDADNASLIHAARDRLGLLGMTSSQVTELVKTKSPRYAVSVFSNYSGFITDLNVSADNRVTDDMQTQIMANQQLELKEGMYIQRGQALFSVYNPARAWIVLDIFPEQQHLVKAGNAVRIVPETSPQQNFRAKIDYVDPVFRTGKKTLSARVYLNNEDMRLPIGSRVTASIFTSSISGSWVPKEAVLSIGRSKVVFLKQGSGFRAHKVTTGVELNRSIQIATGLSLHDSIATNAQFLIDNEAFIKVSNQ
jgi:Cu(I)/Ag(I) efflux system membrane fusion protein